MDSSSSQSSPLTSSHSSPQSSPPSSSSYRSRGSPCFYTTPLASSTDVTVYLRPPLRRNYRTSLEPVQECDGDTATAAISEPPGLLRYGARQFINKPQTNLCGCGCYVGTLKELLAWKTLIFLLKRCIGSNVSYSKHEYLPEETYILILATSKEQEDLEEAAIAAILSPDINTSRHSDLPREDEGSEDDKKFMKEAQEVAMNSPDPQTKVSFSLPLPLSSKKFILFTGWCSYCGSQN